MYSVPVSATEWSRTGEQAPNRDAPALTYTNRVNDVARNRLAGADDLESTILQWRERALGYVMWTLLALTPLPVFLGWRSFPEPVASLYRSMAFSLTIVVLALVLVRPFAYRVRAWAFLILGLLLAAVLLAGRGLEGSGRLILVVLPIYAAVLVGARAGYVAAVVSLALFATLGALHATQIVPRHATSGGTNIDLMFWVVQGTMLLLVVVPVVVLVTGFIAVLRSTVAAERAASERSAEAERERRRLEQVLLQTGDRERRDVGHQLHDGPCQQLTAALLRCKVLQNALSADGSHEKEIAHVGAIADLLDASVAEIHDLARGLSPAELSPEAFPAALGDLTARVRESTSIECSVVYDRRTQPATAEASSQLFRIAQEAIGNAVRHASPSHILVELDGDDRTLRLQVRDDGRGMSEDGDRAGLGLRIMRHRAELIGGSISVMPAPGGGTVVTCMLPRSPAETADESES